MGRSCLPGAEELLDLHPSGTSWMGDPAGERVGSGKTWTMVSLCDRMASGVTVDNEVWYMVLGLRQVKTDAEIQGKGTRGQGQCLNKAKRVRSTDREGERVFRRAKKGLGGTALH